VKNFKTESITEEKEFHISTTCNKCAKTVEPKQVDHYIWETFAYPFFVDFKEGSNYEREKWGFDLCEVCVIELVKSFKIMPEYFDYGEASQESFRNWKQTGIKR
jgi:hypothetical protein